MSLRELIASMTKAELVAFAAACKHSLGHIRNVAYGQKECSAELAAHIERESGKLGVNRTVYRWDLKPDDWHWIWPEAAAHPSAPSLSAGAADAANDSDVRRAA